MKEYKKEKIWKLKEKYEKEIEENEIEEIINKKIAYLIIELEEKKEKYELIKEKEGVQILKKKLKDNIIRNVLLWLYLISETKGERK